MRISLQWLNELIDLKTFNFEYLVEKLTFGGFEVEDNFELLINNKKDKIFEITATANRSDSLSVKGIGKEVSALLNKSYKILKCSDENFEPKTLILNCLSKLNDLNVSNNNCSIFIAITIENLINFNSPKWLQEKLTRSGIETFNNLLDFQNYICLETGYPLEFYDLEKIKLILNNNNFNLSLKSEILPEQFEGINNTQYLSKSKVLTLKANNEILSIAGIITNKKFQYQNTTKSLLVEASIFNSKKIRKLCRNIGLRTDRSSRYEKGLNPSNLVESLCRLLALLKSLNKEIDIKIHTAIKYKEIEASEIDLKYKTIIEILGPVVDSKTNQINQLQPIDISNYLNRLNFNFTFNEKNLNWLVRTPLDRYEDINREIDLIEEIGRIHGFNNFLTILPEISKVGIKDFSYQIHNKLTACFLSEGFNEIINYSFTEEINKENINLINPLSQDYSTLRSTLLSNLLRNVSENITQGNYNLEAFEYGHTFFNYNPLITIEIEQVAGIFGGIKTKFDWSNNPNILSWFEAKGKLQNVFNKLNLFIYWRFGAPKIYENILHPYRSSRLYLIPGLLFGTFGQINPILAKKLNLSSHLYLFEFNLQLIKDEFKYKKLLSYQRYSFYPRIVKDLSFIISQNITFEKIKNTIFSIAPQFLVSIEMLDEYKGKSIPKTMTSLCIQLIFQSNEKTLTTKEIERGIEIIKFVLIQQFKIIVRL